MFTVGAIYVIVLLICIPLFWRAFINAPPMEECNGCKGMYAKADVKLVDNQMLCRRCREDLYMAKIEANFRERQPDAIAPQAAN